MDNSVIDKFSKHLFWDVDRSELDIEKHRKFIVQRVLERGHDKDWELLKEYYSVEGIVETARKLRSLEPTALVHCQGENDGWTAFVCSTHFSVLTELRRICKA
ncbi:MAG: hypothetical protein R6V06_10585, partial [Kiritimatiellia bacterium]